MDRSSQPNISVTEAFHQFLNDANQNNEALRRTVRLAKDKFSSEQLIEIQEILAEIEIAANREANPLMLLREAIMKEVDSSAREEVLMSIPEEDRQKVHAMLREKGAQSSDEISSAIWLHSEILCGVLRLYCSLKYGDATKDDWFAFYVKTARSRARAMIEMFLESVASHSPGVAATLYKAWSMSTPQIKDFVLRCQPGKKVKDIDEQPPNTEGAKP